MSKNLFEYYLIHLCKQVFPTSIMKDFHPLTDLKRTRRNRWWSFGGFLFSSITPLICLLKKLKIQRGRKEEEVAQTASSTHRQYLWWRERSNQLWPSSLALNMTQSFRRQEKEEQWLVSYSAIPKPALLIYILSKLLSSVFFPPPPSSLQFSPSIGSQQEERGAVSRVWVHAHFHFCTLSPPFLLQSLHGSLLLFLHSTTFISKVEWVKV